MDNLSFLNKVATATGIDIETAQKLAQGLSLSISDRVAQGDKVVIPGLGEFLPTVVPEHQQEDIFTGRIMAMPPSQQAVFTASATLKKQLENVAAHNTL